ncbi:MAG: TonB-dependent receptor, partial [Acidobacteriota bacterium]
MRLLLAHACVLLSSISLDPAVSAQSLGAGTLKGIVDDASGAPVPSATVEMSNAVSGLSLRTQTGTDGAFLINNIAPNGYRLVVSLSGFQTQTRDVAIRSAVPMVLNIQLEVAGQQASVTVEASRENLADNKVTASDTVDRQLLAALPASAPDSGLNDAIVYTTPGVAADSNGFFHPLGDHAQVTYVIDGQTISDQRNKVFSTSIPANAIQSMEVISGSPPAEYGDKTSLVINAITRSGLGQKPSGSFLASYGSFGAIGEEATLGLGGRRWGNFLVVNSERTGRFLDTPEFWPMHDIGNTATSADHMDFQPNGKDALHLNLMAARNWMQVPNTYDQGPQDQRQKVVSFNIAPGYQRSVDAHTLLSVNAFLRRDQVDYYPSRDPLDDSPATLAQDRSLTNFGIHADLSSVRGRHNWKGGLQATQTRLDENFSLGITDPAYNSPCANGGALPELSDPAQCGAFGLRPNPGFLSSLLAYDLTRGGELYQFSGNANIHQIAFFGQDSLTLGGLTLSFGMRFDRYDGLTHGSGMEPRAAFSYLIKPMNTVIRGGYTHTIETPTNENLVASSSTGSGGLASNLFRGTADQQPIALGSRNQYDAGIQQSLGK